MITILFHRTVKPGREEEAEKLARELTSSTHAEDDGCITYAFYRQSNEPRQLVLVEPWRDQEALNGHIARLQRSSGPLMTRNHIRRHTTGDGYRSDFSSCSSRPTRGATTRSREKVRVRTVRSPAATQRRRRFPHRIGTGHGDGRSDP